MNKLGKNTLKKIYTPREERGGVWPLMRIFSRLKG